MSNSYLELSWSKSFQVKNCSAILLQWATLVTAIFFGMLELDCEEVATTRPRHGPSNHLLWLRKASKRIHLIVDLTLALVPRDPLPSAGSSRLFPKQTIVTVVSL